MSGAKRNTQEAEDQAIDISGDSMPPSEDESAAPAVRPAKRRGQIVPIVDDAQEAPHTSQQEELNSEEPAAPQASDGGPPLFSGILQLEPKDIKAFEKALKKHKNSPCMKKLATLDYFCSRFSEICYFEVSEAVGALGGVLGYGNSQLVTLIRDQFLSEELLPSIFSLLAGCESFAGPIESLRAEDQAGLAQIGFQSTQFVGAFPVVYKNAITGLWLCTAADVIEIPEKEMKALKKLFKDFVY